MDSHTIDQILERNLDPFVYRLIHFSFAITMYPEGFLSYSVPEEGKNIPPALSADPYVYLCFEKWLSTQPYVVRQKFTDITRKNPICFKKNTYLFISDIDALNDILQGEPTELLHAWLGTYFLKQQSIQVLSSKSNIPYQELEELMVRMLNTVRQKNEELFQKLRKLIPAEDRDFIWDHKYCVPSFYTEDVISTLKGIIPAEHWDVFSKFTGIEYFKLPMDYLAKGTNRTKEQMRLVLYELLYQVNIQNQQIYDYIFPTLLESTRKSLSKYLAEKGRKVAFVAQMTDPETCKKREELAKRIRQNFPYVESTFLCMYFGLTTECPCNSVQIQKVLPCFHTDHRYIDYRKELLQKAFLLKPFGEELYHGLLEVVFDASRIAEIENIYAHRFEGEMVGLTDFTQEDVDALSKILSPKELTFLFEMFGSVKSVPFTFPEMALLHHTNKDVIHRMFNQIIYKIMVDPETKGAYIERLQQSPMKESFRASLQSSIKKATNAKNQPTSKRAKEVIPVPASSVVAAPKTTQSSFQKITEILTEEELLVGSLRLGIGSNHFYNYKEAKKNAGYASSPLTYQVLTRRVLRKIFASNQAERFMNYLERHCDDEILMSLALSLYQGDRTEGKIAEQASVEETSLERLEGKEVVEYIRVAQEEEISRSDEIEDSIARKPKRGLQFQGTYIDTTNLSELKITCLKANLANPIMQALQSRAEHYETLENMIVMILFLNVVDAQVFDVDELATMMGLSHKKIVACIHHYYLTFMEDLSQICNENHLSMSDRFVKKVKLLEGKENE